jgi:hypothetical protein
LWLSSQGASTLPLAGEDQDLDNGQAAVDREFVQEAGGGDRPVVGMGAEHDQRPRRGDRLAQRLADVDELAVGAAGPDRLEQTLEDRLPVDATRRRGLVFHGPMMLRRRPGRN